MCLCVIITIIINYFYKVYQILNNFTLLWFYGISTIVGYLKPNPLYPYVLNIYNLVWKDFMAYQPLSVIKFQILCIHIYQIYKISFRWVLWHINYCWLSKAKSFLSLCHHHHHIVLAAWISLTLSRHSSLSFIALGRSWF